MNGQRYIRFFYISVHKLYLIFFSIMCFFTFSSPVLADLEVDIKEITDTLLMGIIGIGLIFGVFIIPYAVILMASGNQENIKKGREWLNSYIQGLIVVLLSGAIIRIVGTEILGL